MESRGDGKELIISPSHVAMHSSGTPSGSWWNMVEQVKMLGCNVIRFRHFAPDLELVQICEEMGLFVTVELPVSHVPSALLGRESFRSNTRYLIQTLAKWYDASPAVFGWGIAEALPEATAEAQEYQQYAATILLRHDFPVKALINDEQLPLIPAGKKERQWDFVFPVSSVLALFLVFILLNRSRRFQENFVRAWTKSFNFYADIRDQRIIPLPHTLVLLVALSLGVGTFEAALYFYLKSDFRFDWFVDLFFPQPMVKYTIAYLLWNPVELIAVCTAGWILSFLGIALL